jgi:hypothetical protein
MLDHEQISAALKQSKTYIFLVAKVDFLAKTISKIFNKKHETLRQ